MFKQHHLHLRCADLWAARDFYVNLLGARQLRHYTTALGTEIVYLQLNDIDIALSPATPGAPCSSRGCGIYQLGLQVQNMETTVRELAGRGIKFKGPVVEPTPGVKAAFFDAPDGVEIELMELPAQ